VEAGVAADARDAAAVRVEVGDFDAHGGRLEGGLLGCVCVAEREMGWDERVLSELVLIETGLTAFDLDRLRDRVCDLVVPDKRDDLLVSRLDSKTQKIVPR
jgi:hypothetical protein